MEIMTEQVLYATTFIKEFRLDLSEGLNKAQRNKHERQGKVIATGGTLCDIVGNLKHKTNASTETSTEYEQILQTSQDLKEKHNKQKTFIQ